MNKGILIKAGIVLGFFGFALGLAYGCTSIKDKNVTPEIDNREDVYLSVGDIEITNQELWEMMKLSDGLSYLIQMAEEEMLSDIIDNITQAEIDEEISMVTYGTDDEDLLQEIMDDAERKADLELAFRQNIIILGFDPDNADDLRTFAELSIAKQKYTKAFIANAEDGDTLEIDEETMQQYYEEVTKGDVCYLDVRFSSEVEANLVLNKYNIVPNYNLGWGKYFGTEDIDTLGTGDFDETNTTELTDVEAFVEFITMYNYMNPNETPIPTDTTLANFCGSYPEKVLNFDEATNDRMTGDPYLTYVTYLFDTLSLEDEAVRYSYTLQSVSTFKVLAFKVEQADITEFVDLTDTEKADLKEDMIDRLITTNSVETALDELWSENEFEIFDPLLKLQYMFSDGTEFDNQGSETLVAKLGDLEITATMLFDYMESRLGTYYTIEMVKNETLLNSDYYTEMYGESHDYLNSNHEAIAAHRDELREMKSIFSSDGYASYGFSSSIYTWDEFIVLAFGSSSEANVIRDLFVIGNLQPSLVNMDSILYSSAADFVQEAIDEYFSLNAEHLLLYVDFDRDFAPDEFNDIVTGLTGDDLVEYNTLRVAFENLVESRVNIDNDSFTTIVTEFNNSLLDDPENDWAEYKAYGFYIMTESLSGEEQGSLTNTNTTNFDEDFVTALKRIYDAYVVAEEFDIDTDIDFMYDDRLVQSNFGLHFIKATKGSTFEQPTAVYDNTAGDKSEGSDGTTMVPNQAQVDLYIEIRMAEILGNATELSLPSSVYDAITAYYGPVFDSYFTASNYSIIATENMLADNPVYATENTERIEFLENVLEILYELNFPEGFIVPE